MTYIFQEIELLNNSDIPVLIIGETGTGKEVLTHYVHERSKRKEFPIVKVSLSTLPETLIESELFGYEKGSFTGAYSLKKGFFETAHNSTIYLDDIDDFPLHLQSKLLRVIENKEILRIGTNEPIITDVRIIASSKKDLHSLMKEGKFRTDLFYRLSGFSLYLPPLRERKDDIPLLLDYFINSKRIYGVPKIEINRLDLKMLYKHDWPGNIRELHNFAEKISLHSEDEIYNNFEYYFAKYFNAQYKNSYTGMHPDHFTTERYESFHEMVKEYETTLILDAMKKSYGNVNLASRILKIKSTTLRDKIVRYKVDINKFKA